MFVSTRTFLACVPVLLLGSVAWGQVTQRVSVDSVGRQSNGHSWQAWISGNGRYVVFESQASNLVPGDTNGATDIFVRDLSTGQTSRVSVASDGTQGNDHSTRPAISHDGRWVVFQSAADNLVPGDTNGAIDVFVHDRLTGQTRRVSVDSQGQQANDKSIQAHISPDGSHVVFHSFASNLVAGDTNGQWDVFVYDLNTGIITLDSVRDDGVQGNDWSEHATLSGDGRFVAYHSAADNLVPGDANGVEDVFLFDRASRTMKRISEGPNGEEANERSAFPIVSPDGRYVAFESDASNLVLNDTNNARDIFLYDRVNDSISLVSLTSDGSQANGNCFVSSVSTDARYVAFFSQADNLVPGDTNGQVDVFVRDMWLGITRRVSVGAGGQQANGACYNPTISANGRQVAYQSGATNLVSGDTNMAIDVFVADFGPTHVPRLLGP